MGAVVPLTGTSIEIAPVLSLFFKYRKKNHVLLEKRKEICYDIDSKTLKTNL